MYDYKLLKTTNFQLPIISVGNITVGGTGKTPHTEYIIRLLSKYPKIVALSRGYKRTSKGFRLVETDSDVAAVGDEPLQLKCKFPHITVAVDENRVHGIRQFNQQEIDAVILDDAYQHRRINPGVNILLIDYNRPLEKDSLLPAGRLREPKHQQRRANMIIITKCPKEVSPIKRRIISKEVNLRPYQSLYFSTLSYRAPEPVFNWQSAADMSKKASVILVAGVANPAAFREYLSSRTFLLDEMIFADHHRFTDSDIEHIRQLYEKHNAHNPLIFTTEKDAMRFRAHIGMPDELKQHIYYVPVEIDFLDNTADSFNEKILSYVEKYRINRKFFNRKAVQ
jgi:tetraacyldisaccharide 4'-kinase